MSQTHGYTNTAYTAHLTRAWRALLDAEEVADGLNRLDASDEIMEMRLRIHELREVAHSGRPKTPRHQLPLFPS